MEAVKGAFPYVYAKRAISEYCPYLSGVTS